LRYLQDDENTKDVKCKKLNDENPAEYDCETEADEDQEIDTVSSNGDYQFQEENGNDFQFEDSDGKKVEVDVTKSSQANNTESNIQEETGDGKELTEMKALVIQSVSESNHKIILTINSTFLEEFPETKSFKFNSTDFTKEKPENVLFTCKKKSENGGLTDYECYANKNFNGTFEGSMGRFSDGKPFMLNYPTEDGNTFAPGGTNQYSIARQSSGGLKGGAIAAIVIVFLVVVIATIITALLCRRSVKAPKEESTIDTFQQNSVMQKINKI
jgi:hypothetical protein